MITIVHQPDRIVTSKNPVLIKLTSDESGQPNYRFKAVLTLNDLPDNIRATTVNLLEFPLNALGQFDLAAILDAFLNEVLYTAPDLAQTGAAWIEVSPGNICTFSVEISAQYGYPITSTEDPVTLPESESYVALRGGFAHPNWPELKYIYEWLMQAENNVPFLTWKPIKSLVSQAQPEFLTYMYPYATFGDSRAVNLEVLIYYTDGTTATSVFTVQEIETLRTYSIAVGVQQLSLHTVTPAKTISHYKVWVKESATRKTVERFYYVDRNVYKAERFILFANSLGGFDTVRCVGTGEFQSDYFRNMADHYAGRYKRSEGNRRVILNEEQSGRKVNTGFISRADVHWLRDLFLSTEVYTVENGMLVPIEIVSKKFAMPEESDLNSLTIEYDYKFRNEVYTPLPQTVNWTP